LIVGAVMFVVRWRQRGTAHEHGYEHGNGSHAHPHPQPTTTTGTDRAGIAAVAASGGLIPSPSAVVVLLAAIAVDRIPLGVALVVVFSIGLAASLVLVGAISHFAKTWLGRSESRLMEWLPLAAAATIFVVGVVLTIQAAGSVSVLRG
jgi:ABC-type nickel/cobalt efflux system permease component RcnA